MPNDFLVPLHDTTIVGSIWPGSEPTVVLLHAGVADRRSWLPVASAVSKFATVVAYDRRGFGDTAPGSSSFTHLEDLRAVLDQLGVAKVWLVGSSSGGRLALDAAISMADRVAGLILLAPAVSGAPDPTDEEIDPELLPIDEELSKAAADGVMDELNRLEIRLWLDGPRESEGRVVGLPRELALEMNRVALANEVAENSDHSVDAWSHLSKVNVPTLVACGELDANHVLILSKKVSTRIPGASYLPLKGVAHLPFLENPLAVAELVIEAIDQQTSHA
jgi:pimeloyl-ACP methyl ester carboxylesterase